MRHLLALALALGLAAPAGASAIFPPMLAGQASVGIQSAPVAVDANGVPTETPTRAVQLVDELGAVLACVAMGPGEHRRVQFEIQNNARGRVDVGAYAFSEPDCTGLRSDRSPQTAYYFFLPPAPVALDP